uniref:Protein kinase domain-containing protein n=1 Tax=Haemonchus contortus TaxID=6289 RepID=A0A7I4XZ63_HAECO
MPEGNEKKHSSSYAHGMESKGNYEFTVKKGDIVAIPTLAIPYYAKYDNATESSSIYSEPPEDVREHPSSTTQSKTEQIIRSLLTLGYDFDGRPLTDDIIFKEPDQAASFTPMVVCAKPVEIECECLWDFFGGDTCLDINCWAGTELNVVAEEYQIRKLPKGEYLRIPLRWSLARIVGERPQSGLGLIPSCWLVPKKFVQENPGLFSYPLWYLGICDVETAYFHLLSDRSALRSGVFVIFSPVCLNPDPTDYRPFLLMFLCEDSDKDREIKDKIISRSQQDPELVCGSQYYSYELDQCRRVTPNKEKTPKEKKTKIRKNLSRREIRTAISPAAKKASESRSREEDKEKDVDRLAELVASPYLPKILTITRSLMGHYELFGNRYSTLYDLVYHLSITDSELPTRLVYGTLSKPPPQPFCSVPPPCEQPRRDPRACLMQCEQWAARQFDQAVLPTLLAAPFQHVSKTMVDPSKQSHERILRTAGIGGRAKRGVSSTGVTIFNEMTAAMEKYERPKQRKDKKDEDKASKKKSDPSKDKVREPYTNVPKDEFCIVADKSIEINQNDLVVDRFRTLGKGAFGAVYAGEYKAPNGSMVPVAVKSLRLVTTDKDQRLPWISEIEMSHQLNHPNVVRFFGFCMEPADSNILMVFEMMDKGALDSFCRKINYQMSINETVDWLCQIARGMAHLHAQVPSIVHGDLAARNVLVRSHPVDVTRYTLKLTDFGISKRTRSETFATYDDPNKIPFKWLPPEVLKGREMTPKADVWSYGVLIHELYGIGEPYGMMGPEKVIHALNDGHRFERQPKMPHFIYDVCLQCWRRLPLDRPHFREIELNLLPHYIENEASHMEIVSERYRKQQETLRQQISDSNMTEADFLDRH